MKILVDSGVSPEIRNIGDIAILDKTLENLEGQDVEVLEADYLLRRETRTLKNLFSFLRSIIRCNVLWICCGGLFKNTGHIFIARKLFSVGFAKILKKQIHVDPQTLYLQGIWRTLFKMIFRHETIQCRDDSSLEECKRLGLICIRRDDILLEERKKNVFDNKIIGLDTRYKLRKNDNRTSTYCECLRLCAEINGLDVIEIPTIQTDLSWRQIKGFFEKVDTAICVSFHAAIFALNSGVRKIVCIYGDEYYRRKFSALKNVQLVDTRKIL